MSASQALPTLATLGLVLGLSLGLALAPGAHAQTASMAARTTPSGEGQYFRGGLAGSTGVSGGIVAMPNGKYSEYTEDLIVKVPGGHVRWVRDFNGNQWRFNPQWASLEFEFDEILLGSSSSGAAGAAALAVPTTPPEVFGGTRIPGVSGGLGAEGRGGPLWAISRNGAWFTVDASYCNFAIQNTQRYLLKPVFNGAEPSCPTNRFAGMSSRSGGATGEGAAIRQVNGGMPANLAGFRWEDRGGDWIEFERTGRITRYGDRNNVQVSFQYTSGRITGVVDHNGRLVMSLGYNNSGQITDVRDVPAPGDTQPARIVRYTYHGSGSIESVTDVRGQVTRYGYDDKDRLKTITDAEQRVRSLDYGPTNRVIKLTQPDGAVTEYDYDYDKLKKQFLARTRQPEVNGQRRVEVSLYDTDGQLISQEVNNRVQRNLSQDGRTDRITDARGNITEIQRNEYNQVVSVRHADATTLSNQFDARTLNLKEQRDRNGFTHRYEYDDAGNLRRRTVAAGTPDQRVTEYTLDARQRVQSITWKGRTESNGVVTPDATTVLGYDDQDNINSVTDPEGKTTRYTHNRLGQVLTVTEPRGGVWRYGYDNDGNLQTAQSPLGFITTYEQDKVGNDVKMTDARGKVWRSRYDRRDREAASIDPTGAEYTTAYTAIGTAESVTDASGKTLRMEYDAWGRPAKAQDGKGQQFVLDYTEADGQDRGARQPNRMKYPTFERLFKYDPRNRPAQQTDLDTTSSTPDARTEQYTYDGEGRRKTVTDANGKTRFVDYNAFGQMVRMADPMGNAMRVLHDARGNVIAITDPNGRKTTFEYDLRDLLTRETDPLGKTTRYAWDDNGWPVRTELANGNKIEFSHDDDGRLVTQREYKRQDGTDRLAKTTTFSYDADDNLLGWNDGRFSATLTYDDAGRLASETVNYGSFTKSRSYTYHPNNQVKTYTGPDGVTISYAYDAQGQLERVSIPGEGDITVTDWQWAARKKVLLPGGTEQRFEHDGLLMMTKLTVVSPGQATIFELENKYGRLHEVTQTKKDGAAVAYGYDDAYRLTSVQAQDPSVSTAFNEGYTVDASGNRVSHTRTGGATWQYDEAQQLKQRGSVSYEYDDNGNLTRKTDASLAEPLRTTVYAYDAMNRLSELRDGAGAVIASYSYDPFDRRLSKQLGNGSTTYYVPSPNGLLAELDASGQVLAGYGWHPEHDDGMYPLYARVSDGQGGQRYVYYHNDQLGTPQRITDKAGRVVWAAQYDGFGKATVSTVAEGAVDNPLRYPGQYFDAESSLHYNDRRYYDPETGRYLTRDPLGFSGGVNLYAYAAHNPANFTDPTGEIVPLVMAAGCLARRYLICMATCMGLSAIEDYVLECGNINWGENAKDCAIDCALSMLPLPNPCGKFGKWMSAGIGIVSAAWENFNSFTGETLVHVKPLGANAEDAQAGRAVLKPIREIKPGDEVLALSEWKERGQEPGLDARLGYERVTDVFTSLREQTLVYITLDSGEVITATEGHPFKTSEGWRDAILLKRGGKLLLNGDSVGADDRVATLADVRVETKTVQVFNLEVATAHTYFIGRQGVLVHNAKPGPSTNPNAPHNRTIRELGDLITDMGGKILAGGGRLKEKLIRTPCGKKSGRRPDILYEDSLGNKRGINVGKNGANGLPVPREVDAINDLNGAGVPTKFVPYN